MFSHTQLHQLPTLQPHTHTLPQLSPRNLCGYDFWLLLSSFLTILYMDMFQIHYVHACTIWERASQLLHYDMVTLHGDADSDFDSDMLEFSNEDDMTSSLGESDKRGDGHRKDFDVGDCWACPQRWIHQQLEEMYSNCYKMHVMASPRAHLRCTMSS